MSDTCFYVCPSQTIRFAMYELNEQKDVANHRFSTFLICTIGVRTTLTCDLVLSDTRSVCRLYVPQIHDLSEWVSAISWVPGRHG